MNWTVGRRIAAGFIATTALSLMVAAVAVLALRDVVLRKDFVVDVLAANMNDSSTVARALGAEAVGVRGHLLTHRQDLLLDARAARAHFEQVAAALRDRVATDHGRRFVAEIDRLSKALHTVLDAMLAEASAEHSVAEMAELFATRVEPITDEIASVTATYVEQQTKYMDLQQGEADRRADAAQNVLLLVAVLATVLAIVIAWWLGGYVTRQVGSAVAQIQSSSAELQAAANEQAAGTREQTTAMSEVSTTLKELVATARQIADSTQRVVRIAEDTGSAAQTGESTIDNAQQVLESVKRQVDLIVSHMVELGKKSQQIGAIQELINELAEQTNILSINATIESAGAGEAGKRFAVVAEEIRKLADRVGGSGREIRTLVDEIRSAANTTVMVTEDGSKAVDAGLRSFAEVASALSEITRMVDTSTEAARQIELGTRQQVTAVEQVNLTLVDLAQAAKEADASTRQTLETADYLSKLSADLLRMTRADSAR